MGRQTDAILSDALYRHWATCYKFYWITLWNASFKSIHPI